MRINLLAAAILCGGLAGLATAETLPGVKYDGKHAATLRYNDLTVTLDSAPGSEAKQRIPVIKGRVGDQEVFSIEIEDAEAEEPAAAARVVRLDPATRVPQVVVTAFTGGAHCCAVTRIVTANADGAWRVVSPPNLDGIEGYAFTDLDHDGVDEMISVDNDFLYAFECYACSFAPTRVYRLNGTDMEDVTADAKYLDFLRGRVRDIEAAARKDPKLWHSNGFLGGWVAAKSLVGEVDDAWGRMLKSYDRKSDWPLQECTSGDNLDKCPKDKLRDLTFPQALTKLLEQNSYPLPKNAPK
jgi:hypothetical protein